MKFLKFLKFIRFIRFIKFIRYEVLVDEKMPLKSKINPGLISKIN